jgi:archaellum biogenesis protein FlaJ (TadC family)
MNCHGNNHNHNGGGKKHNPIKHMLMMVLCCGLPVLLVGILPFIKIGGGAKALIATISPFICPLMMLFMIPMMFKGMKKEDCCHGKKDESKEVAKIEQ